MLFCSGISCNLIQSPLFRYSSPIRASSPMPHCSLSFAAPRISMPTCAPKLAASSSLRASLALLERFVSVARRRRLGALKRIDRDDVESMEAESSSPSSAVIFSAIDL